MIRAAAIAAAFLAASAADAATFEVEIAASKLDFDRQFDELVTSAPIVISAPGEFLDGVALDLLYALDESFVSLILTRTGVGFFDEEAFPTFLSETNTELKLTADFTDLDFAPDMSDDTVILTISGFNFGVPVRQALAALPGDGFGPAAAVPLPAAGWMLAAGVAALVGARRRSR